MSSASAGKDYRLAIYDGATMQTLGQEQNTSVSFDIERADATNKDSGNWSEGEQTIRSMSVDSNGVANESDTAYGDLEDHYFNNTKPKFRVTSPAGTTYTATGTLESFSQDGAHDDVFNYSVSITSDGTVTKA